MNRSEPSVNMGLTINCILAQVFQRSKSRDAPEKLESEPAQESK
ncbi:MAG: hypothetical protein AAF127_06945 [Pseudomonadota bacterium]